MGAGLIGSTFVHYILEKYPDDKVNNLELVTYGGYIHNLDDIKDTPTYVFTMEYMKYRIGASIDEN